jgi:hypothetical protein
MTIDCIMTVPNESKLAPEQVQYKYSIFKTASSHVASAIVDRHLLDMVGVGTGLAVIGVGLGVGMWAHGKVLEAAEREVGNGLKDFRQDSVSSRLKAALEYNDGSRQNTARCDAENAAETFSTWI